MTDPRPGDEGGQIPQDRYRDAEAALGGADAVEKTTYVEGHGTRPEARARPGTPTATVPAHAGRNALFWIVALVIVLLAIGYLGGLFG
jgi:hypothetical protein